MLTPIAPSTRVYIGPGSNLIGIVTAVVIREMGITGYEVAWWDGNTRSTAWLDPCELVVVSNDAKPIQIGFTGFTGST